MEPAGFICPCLVEGDGARQDHGLGNHVQAGMAHVDGGEVDTHTHTRLAWPPGTALHGKRDLSQPTLGTVYCGERDGSSSASVSAGQPHIYPSVLGVPGTVPRCCQPCLNGAGPRGRLNGRHGLGTPGRPWAACSPRW